MRQTDDEDLVQALEDLLPELGADARHLGRTFTPALRAKLIAAMPGLKERAKTLVELLDSAYYLYAQRPLHLDEKAASLLADGGRALIGIAEKLEAVSDWIAPRASKPSCASMRRRSEQARPGGAASSGGADRPGDIARDCST